MKKAVALILSIALLFSLVGCSDTVSNEKEKTSQPQEIQVTSENFGNYFNLNIYAKDFNETKSYVFGMYDYKSTCNLVISVTPRSDFEVKDVTLTLRLGLTWDKYDRSIYTKDYTEYLDISIPQNGSFEKVISCKESGGISMAGYLPDAHFESVTGKIIINK